MIRLIDANALKREVEKNMDMQDNYLPYNFIDIIDSMPTIEARKRNPWEEGREYDLEDGIKNEDKNKN